MVLRRSRWIEVLWRGLLFGLLLVLMLPTFAFAVQIGHSLVVPTTQLWTLVIGALVPLVTYVLNHVGPWVTEPVKAFVLVLTAAVASALYAALSTSVIGFNTPTLELVLSGIVAALAAHHWLWKPSGVSALLGAGSNVAPVAQHEPAPAHPAKARARREA